MNNDDLERELRSQRGPREAGYTPVHVPMTPEEGPVARRRPSRLPRAAMLVGAGLAGALAVAFAAGVFSGSGLEVGSTSSTTPSAEPSPTPSAEASAAPGTCGPEDVSLAAEPWGGGTGSRGTVVTVSLADGRATCTISHGVMGTIEDAHGTELISSALLAFWSKPVLLEPGSAYTIGVAWSNWCGDAPAEPVSLSFRDPNWPAAVPVTIPTGGIDPVPPCMGSNEPSSLSLTYLEPQS
jgi:hypothetical protein